MARSIALLLAVLAQPATQASLAIVPVANAGVMLRCGGTAVLVDALFRGGVEGYETIPADRRERLETGKPPFDGVRLVLATHRHADHFDAEAVARHLRANDRAEFWGTGQTAGPVHALHPERVVAVERNATRAFAGGRVTFFAVPHNAPHRTTIENSAMLVSLCGRGVFFSGDAELDPADFADVRDSAATIDTAVLPWWFLTSAGGRRVIDEIVRARALWAAHGDLADSATWIAQVRRNYPNAEIAFHQGDR